jgi:glutamate racemase
MNAGIASRRLLYLEDMENKLAPIGVFDSGYGGLTVLKEIVRTLPGYDYIYLGDNARAPYGSRSFDTVYKYTLDCVRWFFDQGCPLVVLACNTASAKALRTIQQKDLPNMAPENRVLGVIRPTTEIIGQLSKQGEVGILATSGTVASESYRIEIEKFYPSLKVYQEACPMWVPLIENDEYRTAGGDYFVKKYVDALMARSPAIDTVLLACTHYPLLIDKIREYLPPSVQIVSQGTIVATSLADYLKRHPEMDRRLSKEGGRRFYTTDDPIDFEKHASRFFGESIRAEKPRLY